MLEALRLFTKALRDCFYSYFWLVLLTLLIVGVRFSDLPPRLMSIGVISRLANKANGVPFGVALAVGGLIVYPQTRIWSYVSAIV